MDLFGKLKLDCWWNVSLYLGVMAIFSSLTFSTTFLEDKHLFGLGLGLVLIGLSFIMAQKKRSDIKPANAYTGGPAMITWTSAEHNFFSSALLSLGVIIVSIFGFQIVTNLL